MALAGTQKTITVAIPTLGRFEEVRDTVEALLRGTRLPSEIIISDQNNPPRLELDAFLSAHTPLIKHLRTEARGVVFNMNSLLAAATGDVILFLDDDIIPSPELVEAHLRNYCDTDAVGVAGRVEQPNGDLPPDQVTKVGAFNRWTGGMTFRFNGLERQKCVFAQGANMSFDRGALLSIGGFDEGFTGNGYFFESDATLRLTRAFPKRFYFDPTATLKHLAAPRGGARVHDRATHHAYFTHNAIRLFRRHSPAFILPLLIGKLIATTLGKAIYRRSPHLATLGLNSLIIGMRQNLHSIKTGISLKDER